MKWIICFRTANNIGPWKLFTSHRPQFGHVFAVRYDVDLDIWMKFECASQRFQFEFLTGEEADYLAYDMQQNCICVETEAMDVPIYAPRWLYCVSFVKHIVGMRKLWVLTPYQLYCELIKRDHRIIFEKSEGDENGVYVSAEVAGA
ncbi:MAG: hypothetical protein VW879_05245 [Opitutae bacterium]